MRAVKTLKTRRITHSRSLATMRARCGNKRAIAATLNDERVNCKRCLAILDKLGARLLAEVNRLDAATTTSAGSDGGSRVETDAPALGADVVVVAPSDEEDSNG